MDIAKPALVPFYRRRSLRWAALAVVVVVLAVIAMFGLGRAAPSVAQSELWIDTAQRGEMRREIRASGVLVPRDIRWVVAGARAAVQEVRAQPGAAVRAETPILELVNPELLANLQKARAALTGAEADIAADRASLQAQVLDQQARHVQAEGDWQLARIKVQAYERAHAGGAISAIDLQQSRIAETQIGARARIEAQRVEGLRRNMVAQLRAAQARRDEAASLWEVARAQVESLQVRAGSAGILQQVEVEPGQQVEVGSKLARVARPGDLLARVQVPEVLAKDLVLRLPATVDTGNGVVQGRVTRIDPAVREGSVSIDIGFDAALPAGARPDLSVDARLLLGSVRDAVNIARPALSAPDGRGSLFVLRPGETTAQRVEVRYGPASSDRIVVRAGLRAGDRIVLSDTQRWNEYDRLRLR